MKIKLVFVFFLLTLWLWYIFPLKQYESDGLISMCFKYAVAMFYSVVCFAILFFIIESIFSRMFWIEIWKNRVEILLVLFEVLICVTGVVYFLMGLVQFFKYR